MADNPFASLGLQQMGREGRHVGSLFGEAGQDLKKLAGAYLIDQSGLRDWANKTFGKAPPTGLEKPDLLPGTMSAGPGFSQQSIGGLGLKPAGGQGFNMGVAPPSAQPTTPAISPDGYSYAPSNMMPTPTQSTSTNPSSIFDDAMERFGIKRFSNYGG